MKSTLGGRFWYLWAASGISSVGDGMLLVALPLLAVTKTHSPLAIAAVVVLGQVPIALLGLPVGAVADRVNRRRLITSVEYVRFVALGIFGLLVLEGGAGLTAIYAAAFILGSLDVVFDVSAISVLPAIVTSDDLAAANSHLINAEAVGQEFTGRAAGGFLVAVSQSLPFLIDAASFVASAVLMSKAVPNDEITERTGTSTMADLRSGLRWYFRHSTLRRLTLLVATMAFCQTMVMALTALWSRQVLHLSDAGYGLLLAVTSVGNVVGGLLAPRVRRVLGSGVMIVTGALVAAVTYPVLASIHSAAIAAAVLTLESIAVVSGRVAATTLQQTLVPAELRGRGAAAYRTVVLSSVPLGGVVGGLTASLTSIRTAFTLAGILQLAFLVTIGPALVKRSREPIGKHSPFVDLTDQTKKATTQPVPTN